jgi:pimeloyl-ACP methyl ester carboxylesterase
VKPGLLRFVAGEVGAYALHGLLGARRRRPLPAAPALAGGPTVLLIHGHGGTGAAFHFLERALGAAGHTRFASWEYDGRGSVDEVARRLASWAAPLGDSLHVVGHSLGGIVARVWLQELGGRDNAISLTTLSTPHRGLARMPGARLLPLVRELGAGSPLLERLDRSVAVLDGLPALSVVSTRDHFVRPWNAAAFGVARLERVDDAGHVGLLFSRRVHRLVAEHIDAVMRRRP